MDEVWNSSPCLVDHSPPLPPHPLLLLSAAAWEHWFWKETFGREDSRVLKRNLHLRRILELKFLKYLAGHSLLSLWSRRQQAAGVRRCQPRPTRANIGRAINQTLKPAMISNSCLWLYASREWPGLSTTRSNLWRGQWQSWFLNCPSMNAVFTACCYYEWHIVRESILGLTQCGDNVQMWVFLSPSKRFHRSASLPAAWASRIVRRRK